MLPYFVLGIGLLAGLLLAARWFATADTRTVIRVGKRVILALLVSGIVFLVVTGRLNLAMMALPLLLPWLLRLHAAGRMAHNYTRMRETDGGTTGGRRSAVQTRYLKAELDHDSGSITGEVVAGRHRGRRLEQMALADLLDLMGEAAHDDPQSAQVLEAFLERAFPDWRSRAPGGAAPGGGQAGGAQAGGGGAGNEGAGRRDGGERRGFAPGRMGRDEALQILGLTPSASKADIKAAYHRLMANLHPDRGGSTYLAAKLNEAKEVLLGD